MCSLPALASKIAHDDQLLGSITGAILKLRLDAAGKARALGFKPEDLAKSRRTLCEFLEILLRVMFQAEEGQLAILQNHAEQTANSILLRIDEQGKLRAAWIEATKITIQHLQEAGPSTADWELLDQLVSLLGAELSRNLVALKKV